VLLLLAPNCRERARLAQGAVQVMMMMILVMIMIIVIVINMIMRVLMMTTMMMRSPQAAKDAMVKHVVVISSTLADRPDTILGAQFEEMERRVSGVSLPVTFLRLPLLMESLLAHQVIRR
jgi:hypothetical protein